VANLPARRTHMPHTARLPDLMRGRAMATVVIDKLASDRVRLPVNRSLWTGPRSVRHASRSITQSDGGGPGVRENAG
jgi:hypothetical protein